MRESRGEGRRKPATPPMPRVEVDSPQLDHATVFWGRFFSRHHKTAEKASPQRPGILRASVISRLDPYNRLRGPVREKRPLALTRRGFFLSGLFRGREATPSSGTDYWGRCPQPPGRRVYILVDQPLHFSNNINTLHNYHQTKHEKRAEIRRQTSIFGPASGVRRPACSSVSVSSA